MSSGVGFALIALAGIAAVAWQWGKQPIRHKVSLGDLRELLALLLKRGFDGGFLIIKAEGSSKDPRFVQFSKYMGATNVGLQFDFPRVNWSTPYYQGLQDNLQARGIDYRREPTFRDDTTEFLHIDLAQDLDKAVQVAEIALISLGLKPDARLEAWFVHVNPRDVET